MADPSNVKVYTVNGAAAGSSSSLPDWLIRKRASAKGRGKRAAREHIEGTIELIQGFEFPEASNRIKTTPDGQHAIATGTYKPQMKVWDLGQLSQKFERHSDAENVDFIVRESCRSMYPQSLTNPYSVYRMIGPNQYISKMTALLSCTPKGASTTELASLVLAAH